jgi:ABC-type glycerol-3-phosphate transport system substrate-binding protein
MLDDQGDPPRLLNMLFQPALQELRARHPDIDIQLDYRPIPYLNLHTEFLKTMANQTSVDIMSVDQIWLGEFVEKGYLTDLTDRAKSWGREKDWYEANWDGGVYKDKVYGIWTVADLRGMWYWKELLNKAGVDPNSLQTWDGYITSAKKLNSALRPQGIEGVHLVAAGHSPDMSFYPYLWMLGGDIIKQKDGHPTKGTYWFPAYNMVLDPKIMTPLHVKYGHMPTQIPIGEGPNSAQLKQTIPYYNKLISMMTIARARPSIPEYPHIAEDIHQALDQVFYKVKEPKQALDDAAAKSAKAMGW